MMQARYANALYSRPWMANVGAYPGAQPGNALSQMAAPQQPMQPAPAMPAPIFAGSAPVDVAGGEGTFGGNPDAGMPGPSPNQTLGGVVDALGNVVSFALAPMSSALQFGYQAVTNPSATSISPFGSLSDFLGLNTPTAPNTNAVIGATPNPANPFGMTQTPGVASYSGLTFGAETVNNPSLTDAIGATQPNPDNPFGMTQTPGTVEYSGNEAAAPSGPTTDSPEANAMGAFMAGGYTGGGHDGRVQPHMPAGTVHEGEVVLNADATRHYGPDMLLKLNRKAVPKNKLAALARRY